MVVEVVKELKKKLEKAGWKVNYRVNEKEQKAEIDASDGDKSYRIEIKQYGDRESADKVFYGNIKSNEVRILFGNSNYVVEVYVPGKFQEESERVLLKSLIDVFNVYSEIDSE